MGMQSTEVTKQAANYNRGKSSAQALEWLPLLPTKLNSAVLILGIKTSSFLFVVGEMILQTVGILCSTWKPTNHVANS